MRARVRQAVSDARRALEAAGCPSPQVDAEAMLCHLLGWKPHHLLLESDSNLSSESLAEYRSMVQRRQGREPLQHILGTVDFMRESLLSGPGALIPRPETEHLVELLVEELRRAGVRSILDIGTGSAPILIALAAGLPEAEILVGTDIALEALRLASSNVRRSGHSNRAHLVACDLASCINTRFDAVVANLPYVSTGDIARLQPEVRLWEPGLALDGGPDGMKLIRRLLGQAERFTSEGGLLALETGIDQADVAARLLSENRGSWSSVRVTEDLSGRPRYVLGRRARV